MLEARLDMLQIDKKVREARFFLRKMQERAQMAFGDHEEVDFYLSAFLSAGRSVDYRLRHEQGTTYTAFRTSWNSSLLPDEEGLMKFLVDDRNVEVHESGSNRTPHESRIPVFGSYSDRSGTLTDFSPPGTPPAQIIKPMFCFTIDGQQLSVIEACSKYIALLERLVREYKHAQGIA